MRILHLGNVANYAYVNAKIMRRLGIEAHVFDPDFYHIMATPEWQEAKFEARFNDQFKPIWRDVDLDGFTRPQWFVQGPFVQALSALAQIQGERQPTKFAAAQFNLKLATRRAIDDFGDDGSRFVLASGHPLARGLRAPLTLLSRLCAHLARPQAQTFAVPDGFPKHALLDPALGAQLANVLSYYDVVQGYTLSAQLAAQVGHPNYVACELGTLRGLPFEVSPVANWRHGFIVMRLK
ncbi:MAG: hypothetical protein HC788_15855 [Sphingopyxis sp.]|nr:hypothetical protein [Sphingopyxis sp.]